ncbi:E3 ubiquitin-protein ligase BRE1-like 1 [Sesamum alatum]|uniref:E3 ubiquitin protein ligase n=1 Tax=Sesamum alatum TaxID=300844 RepID=A0AAE1XMC7_9LAMI|nr:E3 ubiquitin-protein ligase BRE1-like 1 [Sesamum alatum]
MRESITPLLPNRNAMRDDRPGIPQLFTSVPTLSDAASYLAETTSILTRCFTDISVRPVSEDTDGQEMLSFVSGEARVSIDNRSASPSASVSSVTESIDTKFDAPVVHGAIMRSTTGQSSQNSNVLLRSNNTNPSGISMFQGLIERVRRTVRGSADDIGWLQHAEDMPPVEDGTGRFMEIIDDIRHGLHWLPNTMVYLLVPGLFSNHGPLYFVNTKTSFLKMGLTCHIAKIHSGVDAAAALSMYWDELKDKVAGLALAQSPYGGSPIASDILREGQLGDYVNIRKLMEILICKVMKECNMLMFASIVKGDMQALEDLTYEKRKDFLRKYQLPEELPVVSFHTEAGISPAVLATLSRVAHAELPTPLSAGQPTTLPVVIPLGAAMAACAQLLQIRYGEKSDGLVTRRDAEVPGSVVVRPTRKLDHAWMVYSSLDDDPLEANASQRKTDDSRVLKGGFLMGSTGEADKRRRHFSSISPTAGAAMKQPLAPLSEEKKLVDDLESRSNCTLDSVKHGRGFGHHLVKDDGDSLPEDALLSRLLETGATESSSTSSASTILHPTEEHRKIDGGKTKNSKSILPNIVASFDDLNNLKHRLYTASLKTFSSNGHSQKVVSSDLQSEVKNLRIAVLKLHLKHKSLAGELQSHRDADARNKAVLKHLKGELESTISELEESNRKLAILKAERDVAKGAFFPVLNRGNKQVTTDKARDKQRDLQEMESSLKELLDQSASRLHELKRLHVERLDILRHLSDLQSNLKNVKSICSSKAYLLLKDQMAKTRADVAQYQALYEKLQVEKESLYWREKESHMKSELADVLHRTSAVADSRISDLELEIQRYVKEKNLIETKLQEASKEPGRREIIAEFKALVSSFPEKMGRMQNHLAKHKETAADIHRLRANVESLTDVLGRKISDLKLTKKDLKLFLDMYGHQLVESREVSEARSSEIKAWAHVQGLKSSLDERNLELRVKAAIEAEAIAQQRLAASEAEIAELRQKLEASKRDKTRLSDVLKSKHEETEAYLSEIETIGQAYDDMQTQNQQLLQQITERDEYNVKLVLEGVRARQTEDALLMEKRMLEKGVQQTKKTVDFYDYKAGKLEDQLKGYSDHMQRLAEDRVQNAAAVENTQRRLLDVRKSSQQLMGTLDEAQSQVEGSRASLAQLQIELEKERFERKRVEEDLDTLRRKAEQLKSQAEGSSVAEKLRQELREYKEILKCSVCLDRRKEVVITKCYHLFCNPCVQRIIESRHRKCPVCAASFGANDVKPVYI